MQIIFQCIYCKHFIEKTFCDAFPKGIPKKIIQYKHDHKNPYPGDKGIRFEPIKEE